MQQPIILDTVARYVENGHGIEAECEACHRWAKLDLAGMVAAGRGALRIAVLKRKVRCSVCGGPGKLWTRAPNERPRANRAAVNDAPGQKRA